jgi:hypothetical protein
MAADNFLLREFGLHVITFMNMCVVGKCNVDE